MSRRERQRRLQRNRPHPVRKVLLTTLLLVVCGGMLAGAAAVSWVVSVADSAPNINKLHPKVPGEITQVFAADGTRLGYIYSDNLRVPVGYGQIPLLLRRATVAIEDRRFWQHGGVDYLGLLRAGIRDLFGGGGSLQGGSTLTMQLVSNIYLPYAIKAHHNIRYKIIQAKLADELESTHSRQWILTQYLNDVDYGTVGGRTAIGVGAASQMFFDKPVWKLDLAQMALLAGLPQAPSDYNPFYAKGLALARRAEVLAAMVQAGYITQAQADRANRSGLQVHYNPTYESITEPYVFDYIKQQLIDRFGVLTAEQGGLKVYTYINLHDQALALQAIDSNGHGLPSEPAAALVSIDPTNGHIVAMQNSTTYNQSNFNYAADAQRQTGSAFKVFVLMTLIREGYDPYQTYYNSHFLAPGWCACDPTWSVHTAEMSYQGEISVAHATTVSDNTVFAQLGQDLGMTNVDQTAHQMGITTPLFGFGSEAIGGLKIGVSPLQMADAYATLANGGIHYPPTIIAKVVFPDGSVVNLGNPKGTPVFTPAQAYEGTQVLESVVTAGTGTAADYGCPAAGKTGTTSNFTDAWFVGYTPQYSTAVWVGWPHSIATLGPNGFGGTMSAPIWHAYMLPASNGYCGNFTVPAVPFTGTAFVGHYSQASVATTSTPSTTTPTTTTATSTTPTTPGGGPAPQPAPGASTNGGAGL